MLYFTSDLHFGHSNIVKFTDRNKVTTSEEHDNWLIDLWNKQVKKSDTVYVLGDISFAKFDRTAEIFSKLNGAIFVVKGNHDRREDLDKLKNLHLIQHWYEYKEIKHNSNSICLFHFAIACWHKQGHGSWHLYGHSHGNYQQDGLCLDVGIDSAYNIFGEHRLFSYEDVQRIMQTKEVQVKDHHKIVTKEN